MQFKEYFHENTYFFWLVYHIFPSRESQLAFISTTSHSDIVLLSAGLRSGPVRCLLQAKKAVLLNSAALNLLHVRFKLLWTFAGMLTITRRSWDINPSESFDRDCSHFHVVYNKDFVLLWRARRLLLSFFLNVFLCLSVCFFLFLFGPLYVLGIRDAFCACELDVILNHWF